MGGKVYEVDFLHARENNPDDALASDAIELRLPSTEKHTHTTMRVRKQEQQIL